jgi:hypothetical protein
LDFIADQLVDARRFRALTVVDIYTRESLAIEAGQNLKGGGCGDGAEPDHVAASGTQGAVL